MEDLARDVVFQVGGKWPVIGAAVVAMAVAFWLAYKAWDTEFQILSYIAGGAGAAALLSAVLGFSAAQDSCRQMWSEDRIGFNTDNCQTIVHCSDVFGCS